MIVKINTEPTNEPVTVDEFHYHARTNTLFDDGAGMEDDYIQSILKAARKWCEDYTGRVFVTQTWDYYLERWTPGGIIEIPKPPLVSVSSITYTDSDGTENTWAASNYSVDTDSEPGRVILGYQKEYPTDTLHPKNPIKITFVAGQTVANVPPAIKAAIKLLASHLYENREPYVVGRVVSAMPKTIEFLLDPFRREFL